MVAPRDRLHTAAGCWHVTMNRRDEPAMELGRYLGPKATYTVASAERAHLDIAISWVRIRSHIRVQGNERADRSRRSAWHSILGEVAGSPLTATEGGGGGPSAVERDPAGRETANRLRERVVPLMVLPAPSTISLHLDDHDHENRPRAPTLMALSDRQGGITSMPLRP